MARIGTDIARAAALLEAGDLVAIPTETVYGLAANALDARAVARIYEAKGRPAFNPLIVHVPDIAAMRKYVSEISPLALRLAEKFSPGPLTYILPKAAVVPDIVTAGGESVAIRIPAHPMALEILRRVDFPLAAPSANLSGHVSPVTAVHVADQLGDRVAYILDGGPCLVGLESTVVRVTDTKIEILRDGGVTREELAAFAPVSSADGDTASPGQLASHYAPRVPLKIGNATEMAAAFKDKKVGLITLTSLSPAGDLVEAAQNFFSRLRELDATVDVIIAEYMPNTGLGVAINDRLTRAAAERHDVASKPRPRTDIAAAER